MIKESPKGQRLYVFYETQWSERGTRSGDCWDFDEDYFAEEHFNNQGPLNEGMSGCVKQWFSVLGNIPKSVDCPFIRNFVETIHVKGNDLNYKYN